MGAPFGNIGFTFDDTKSLEPLIWKALDVGNFQNVIGGSYCVYEPGGGAQLWLHINENREFVECHPHFKGKGAVYFRIDLLVPDDPIRMGGNILGEIFETNEETGERFALCPLMVSYRHFDVEPRPLSGDGMILQITAFASLLVRYSNEDEFTKSARIPNFAVGGFIPSGLFFSEKPNDEYRGSPNAIFCGTVLECGIKRNPAGGDFLWALVKTLVGTFDVVADLSAIDGPCSIGSIIYVEAWLSGFPVGRWKPNPNVPD